MKNVYVVLGEQTVRHYDYFVIEAESQVEAHVEMLKRLTEKGYNILNRYDYSVDNRRVIVMESLGDEDSCSAGAVHQGEWINGEYFKNKKRGGRK